MLRADAINSAKMRCYHEGRYAAVLRDTACLRHASFAARYYATMPLCYQDSARAARRHDTLMLLFDIRYMMLFTMPMLRRQQDADDVCLRAAPAFDMRRWLPERAMMMLRKHAT